MACASIKQARDTLFSRRPPNGLGEQRRQRQHTHIGRRLDRFGRLDRIGDHERLDTRVGDLGYRTPGQNAMRRIGHHLEGAGLVSRVNVGDNVWRFELRDQDTEAESEHPHFVCVECGEITCLSHVRVKLTPAPGSIKSVVNRVSEVLLKGQCTRCA